jgi:NAD(P)-dependent dehydrogenase (short-subunit alcohol dehydrogenase family)
MTRAFALDGREFGIAVSVLQPGNTETPLWDGRVEQARREGIMSADELARVAVIMATLPADVNMLEAIVLPLTMPFVGRG